MRPKLFKVGPCSGEMSTKLPTDGSAIQSSYNTTNNNNPLSPVPSEGGLGQESRATKPAPDGDLDKVPTSCTKVLTDDVSLANVYEENCVNDNHCDSTKMSPVEGPVNDIPKTMFDKSHDLSGDTTTTTHQGEGCEQFSGQIVYNPDGSAYIIEENDETLLDQIPTQEGSIVERAGKCLPEVEYPKIDQVDMSQIFFIEVANIFIPRHQAVYIERRKAWYKSYLQLLQGGGQGPDSQAPGPGPNVHNFKVVSVADKLASARPRETAAEGTVSRQ